MGTMSSVDVEHFCAAKDCVYRDERYSVRDNGAVLRHPKEGGRVRASDNKWTFGKEDATKGYLYISGVQVHRIVATAFHGEPEDPSYVVDHIDTNRRNNRPENLRWLSRLENVLKNPVTRKKVEHLCGSIEAFLDNPALLREAAGNPNFEWMRAVTAEEAKHCKERMHLWASSPPEQRALVGVRSERPNNPTRLLKPIQKWEAGLGKV